METDSFIELLFTSARRAGFSAWEVYLADSESREISVFNGEVNETALDTTLNLGFRGLFDGQMGCASTQVLDEDAADMLVTAAQSGARLCRAEDESFIFAGSDTYPDFEIDTAGVDALRPAEMIDLARRMERAAHDFDDRIAPFDASGIFAVKRSARLINSRGLDLSSHGGFVGAYCGPLARAGERSGSASRRRIALNATEIDVDALAREAAGEAVRFLDAKSIASGHYPLILRHYAARTLLSTFSSLFSAENAQKGLSLLRGREGEQIADRCVTLRDDPLMAGSAASRRFDGEGVAVCARDVIAGGKLETLLHNLKSAHHQGVETTGNAARASCAGPITVAPSNFYIVPAAAPQTLTEGIGRGLVITELMGMHAGANPVSGDFSLGAKGFLIENGRADRPVNQITIAGNFLDLMRNINAVGDDLEFGMPGVSRIGSPSLRINELSVAGI